MAEIEELPAEEVRGWLRYFERYPPGWREDSRIGSLIQVVAGLVGSKIKPEDVFASLKMMKNEERKEMIKRAKSGNPDYKDFLRTILPLAGRPEDGD